MIIVLDTYIAKHTVVITLAYSSQFLFQIFFIKEKANTQEVYLWNCDSVCGGSVPVTHDIPSVRAPQGSCRRRWGPEGGRQNSMASMLHGLFCKVLNSESKQTFRK